MLNRLKLIHDVIAAFHDPIASSGWAPSATTHRFSHLEEAVLLTLLRKAFSDSRLQTASLLDFVKATTSMFSWLPGGSEERELVLSTLLFAYDRDLMIHSKQILTKDVATFECDAPFLAGMNKRIADNWGAGVFDGAPDMPSDFGLSLVVTYSYEPTFESDVRALLACVGHAKTTLPHFTILNVGLNMPISKLNAILDCTAARVSRSLAEDYGFGGLAQRLLECCSIRSEIRVMGGGEIVFFGTGGFSRTVHQLRLRLLTGILPLEVGLAFGTDKTNIWTHSVYTRLKEQLHVVPAGTTSPLQAGYLTFSRKYHIGLVGTPAGDESRLLQPQLELVAFADKKAICQPLARRILLVRGTAS